MKNNLRLFTIVSVVFFVLPSCVLFLNLGLTGVIVGDFTYEPNSSLIEQALQFFKVISPCLVALIVGLSFWTLLGKRQPRILRINESKNNKVLAWAVMLNLGLTMIFGVGAVGQSDAISYPGLSFLANIFPLNILIIVAYIYRLSSGFFSSRFLFILVLYMILQLLRGWAGIFLQLLFWGLVFANTRKKFFLYTLVTFILFLSYPIIQEIRDHSRGIYSDQIINIEDVIFKVIGRISPYSNAIYIDENYDKLKIYLTNAYGDAVNTSQEIVLGFLPKKLIGVKEVRTINNAINEYDAGSAVTTSVNTPIWYKLELQSNNIIEIIFHFIVLLILIYVILFLSYIVGGDFIYLYSFYNVLDFLLSGNGSTLGYLFYSILIILIFGKKIGYYTSRI